MTCGENGRGRLSTTYRAWKTGTRRSNNYNKALIISPLIKIDLTLHKIIRVRVCNLNIPHLKKSLTAMLFWLLEPFSQDLMSLQAEVVAVVAVAEGPRTQVVGLVPVLVEGDLALDPLYSSHNMVLFVDRVRHRQDNLKTVSAQSPHVIRPPCTVRVSFHVFVLSAS